MTFQGFEQSSADGRPIGLYHFRWGNTAWFYTSADSDIVYDGETFVAEAVSDNGVQQSVKSRQEFVVVVPAGLPVVALFRSTPPSEPVYIIKRKKHQQDAEAPIDWIGKIGNIVRHKDGTAEIVCRNSGIRRAGLRLTWCRSCPHFVFDGGCGLNKSGFAVTRNVTATTGNSFTVDGSALQAAPYYEGGFVEWDADGLGTVERRGIEQTLSGDNHYQLFGKADGLVVGQAITLYPGCDGTAPTCNTKFANLDNHGGLAFMPGKSPFDGTSVF